MRGTRSTQVGRPQRGRPAVFLDRDGTLIEDRGFLSDPGQVVLVPGILPVLRRLQEKYLLFVVTNQSGVAAGAISLEQVRRVNARLGRLLEGVRIEQWYVCPHGPQEGCECRKPGTLFLRRAAREYAVPLERSFVIGDHLSDVGTADAVGACGLYVLSGHGMKHLDELSAEGLAFPTVVEAGDWILKHPGHRVDLEREVRRGAEILHSGGIGAFPTETVYGLGGNALDPGSVARIFEVKRRPLHDPLIVHIHTHGQLEELVVEVPPKARRLIEHLWPGPLTIVLPKRESVPELVTAGGATVAVRLPSHPIAASLIRMSGVPVAAPSANLFGRISPTLAAHVREQLGGKIDFLIDGGASRVGVESTVVSFASGTAVILRSGGTPRADLERLIGPVEVRADRTGGPWPATAPLQGAPAESPGQLPSHYAPRTPLSLGPVTDADRLDDSTGLLVFRAEGGLPAAGPVEALSSSGSLKEAAANLYGALHRLDARGLKRIVAESVPEEGLGAAINDRLRRAAAGSREAR